MIPTSAYPAATVGATERRTAAPTVPQQATHGAAIQARWLRTPADGRRHLFRPDHVGELVAQAVCEWRVRTSTLTSAEDGVRCYSCRLLQLWNLDRGKKCSRG